MSSATIWKSCHFNLKKKDETKNTLRIRHFEYNFELRNVHPSSEIMIAFSGFWSFVQKSRSRLLCTHTFHINVQQLPVFSKYHFFSHRCESNKHSEHCNRFVCFFSCALTLTLHWIEQLYDANVTRDFERVLIFSCVIRSFVESTIQLLSGGRFNEMFA